VYLEALRLADPPSKGDRVDCRGSRNWKGASAQQWAVDSLITTIIIKLGRLNRVKFVIFVLVLVRVLLQWPDQENAQSSHLDSVRKPVGPAVDLLECRDRGAM
jgi:hypothetical protein